MADDNKKDEPFRSSFDFEALTRNIPDEEQTKELIEQLTQKMKDEPETVEMRRIGFLAQDILVAVCMEAHKSSEKWNEKFPDYAKRITILDVLRAAFTAETGLRAYFVRPMLEAKGPLVLLYIGHEIEGCAVSLAPLMDGTMKMMFEEKKDAG